MNIVSVGYLGFLAIVFLLYFLVPKGKQKYVLLAASYFYFWTASEKLIVFLLISTLVVYLSGLVMGRIDEQTKLKCEGLEKKEKKEIKARDKKKKLYVVLASVLINLGLLVALKYVNFLGSVVNGVFNTNIPSFKLLLPMGISYYTLQAVSYSVDVYRGSCKPSKDLAKVALYLSYFPHIIEGPFSRFYDVGEQLCQPHSFDYSRMKFGLQLMLWGFFKKMVIADRAAQFVNQAFDVHAEYTGIIIALGVVLYTVQIYAEFSGCIDIMSGISQCLGIRLPLNFRQPFFSKSVQEFWQRWHITLGLWFKEYIFFPVSCAKPCLKIIGTANKRLPKYLARIIPAALPLFFVWFANGIWHGASFKYIFYGLYYYGLMMLGLLFEPVSNKLRTLCKISSEGALYRLWQMLRTNILVLLGMMIFRADSLMGFFRLLKRLFSFRHIEMLFSGEMFYLGYTSLAEWGVLLFGMLLMFFVDLLHEKNWHLRECLAKQKLWVRWAVYYGVIIAIMIFGIYGPGYDAQAFIYAGF